MKSKQPIN